VRVHGPERVTDITEYIESQLQVDKRKSIGTPAGLIIHSIENDLPIPAAFTTSR
jgi:hypothetical protein